MEQPTSNHVRPVIYGGSLTDANKVICCEPCDRDKGRLTLTAWAARLRAAGDPRLPTVVALRAARKAAKGVSRVTENEQRIFPGSATYCPWVVEKCDRKGSGGDLPADLGV